MFNRICRIEIQDKTILIVMNIDDFKKMVMFDLARMTLFSDWLNVFNLCMASFIVLNPSHDQTMRK